MASRFLSLGLIMLMTCSFSLASDSSPLQDFCVADRNGPVHVNGYACKDPKLVEANDFLYSGLHLVGNTSNALGSQVTRVTVDDLPGLNTLGISMSRLDIAPWGVNPPHTHPRSSEMVLVTEGSMQVGFITSNPKNRLFSKVLQKGDIFIIPDGLIHFQRNVGHGNAVAIVALSSQNPGLINIPSAVFGANPDIPNDLLAKAFQVDVKVVDQIQSNF